MLCQNTKVSKISTGIFWDYPIFAVYKALAYRAGFPRAGIPLETSLGMLFVLLPVLGE